MYLEFDEPEQLGCHVVGIRMNISFSFILSLSSSAIVSLRHRSSAVVHKARGLEHITCTVTISIIGAAVEGGIREVWPQPTALSTVETLWMKPRPGRIVVLERQVLGFESPSQLVEHGHQRRGEHLEKEK